MYLDCFRPRLAAACTIVVIAFGCSCAIPIAAAESTGYVFSHLAGSLGGPGKTDGTGSAARFSRPRGTATDSTGSIFVADELNHSIRKIVTNGEVTTFAGRSGTYGSSDGQGANALFRSPTGVAIDSANNLYVTDAGNYTIRKITPAGLVTTLAGTAGRNGAIDGIGSAARFSVLRTLAVGPNGTLYIVDGGAIRKLSSTNEVTTFAGTVQGQASVDGMGTIARFSSPEGLNITSDGTVYVSDLSDRTLRKISPEGLVSTFAGASDQHGLVDGTGSAARFTGPTGMVRDAAGDLVVVDVNGSIRKVTPAAVVTTDVGLLPGAIFSSGSNDGTGGAARFNFPTGISRDLQDNLYVADTGNSTIRKVTPSNVVTTVAGSAPLYGSVDGTGASARFERPHAVAVDANDFVFVADYENQTIRKITPAGVVTTFAGNPAIYWGGSADGTGGAAQFYWPAGIAVDAVGNVFVADSGNHTVRKITAAGVVTTYVGVAGERGSIDGPRATARLTDPTGVAVDLLGNVYVAATGLRKITPAGVVSTIAAAGSAARVAVSADGTLFVASAFNPLITKITPAGVASTLAGGDHGYVDGPPGSGRFSVPSGLAVDPAGNVLVADYGNAAIRKVTPDGTVSTVGGTGILDSADGMGVAAGFNEPRGIAVSASGVLYIADTNNHSIRKGVPVTIPELTWQDPTAIFYGDALGVAQLNATASIPGTFTYSPVAGTVLDVGAHSLIVRFVPSDGSAYGEARADTTIIVGKRTPSLTWSQPSAVRYGVPLSAVQLAATTTVSGSIVYSPAAGSILNAGTGQIITANFTPTDGTRYANTSATQTISVTKAVLTARGVDVSKLQGAENPTLAISYSGFLNGDTAAGLDALPIASTMASTGSPAGTYPITLSGGADNNYAIVLVDGSLTISLGASAPSISTQPTGQSAVSGSAVSFSITATGFPTPSFQWQVSANGVDWSNLANGGGYEGVSTATLSIFPAGENLNGRRYRCTATNTTGATNSASAMLTVMAAPPAGGTGSRLANISARGYCGTSDRVMIGGFVVSGNVGKRVLVRAIGPSLTSQGIGQSEVLLDPMIEVHKGLPVIAENDDWQMHANLAEINSVTTRIGAGPLASTDTKSAVLLLNLEPGVYTFVAKGKAGSSGIVLLEVYDADAATGGSEFINIATRAYATTGNGVTIGGFVIGGEKPKQVLLRAVGPTLLSHGVQQADALLDPMIKLHDALHANATIGINDNWSENMNATTITMVSDRVGATPLIATDSRTAALLVTLQPGVYSFIASGKGGTSGVVLVEVYDAD